MRPSIYTEELAERIFAAIRNGATQKAAAGAVGVTEDTLSRWKKERPDFKEGVEDAKRYALCVMENNMFTLAMKGDVAAGKYWLNNRSEGEWSDRKVFDVSNKVSFSTFEEMMNHYRTRRMIPAEPSPTELVAKPLEVK